MIHQILVGIDGSDYGDTAVQWGIMLAKKYAATLHGLHVVDIVQVESPLLYDLAGAVGAAPMLHLTGQMRQNLEARGQHLMQRFQETCRAAQLEGIPHLATGIISTEILRLAEAMDLMILGRGGVHTLLSKALLGSAVETVIRRSSIPTLVTTQYYYPVTHPLIATDGSPSATAALHSAALFARLFGLPLRVVHCATDAVSGQACLDEARRQLAAYPIPYEVDLCLGNAHEDLVQYLLNHNHDMLFLGAFGRRRVVEWVLGSTTQYLLRVCPTPLLLCHATKTAT